MGVDPPIIPRAWCLRQSACYFAYGMGLDCVTIHCYTQEKGVICMMPMQVVLSTKPGATIGGNTLPVSYSKFTSMVKQGDTIFLGRYLVTGSEESSCYLTVSSSCLLPSFLACYVHLATLCNLLSTCLASAHSACTRCKMVAYGAHAL